MTNNVVLEAVADLDAATIIVVVSTELPVTPAWLAGPVARSFERGARFFEFVFSSDQRQFETGAANEHHPPLAASVEELQSLFRTALRSVLERQ